MQDFRKLQVWARAHALALAVRRAARGFPRTGFGSLRNQMIRAAESIATNIVEGCGAESRKEFARFLEIAIKSAMELEYHLQLANDCDVISPAVWQELSAEVIEVRRMLQGLRRRVLEADSLSRPHE
ncbi:MAG: four helix bundle protein [Gemmatimonadaceae bacterium]